MKRGQSQNKDLERIEKAVNLENKLKNVVMRRLAEIKAIKGKPSLKEMVQAYLSRMNMKDERARLRIKEKVLHMYEQTNFVKFEENDPNFNKIIVHIERILKISTA